MSAAALPASWVLLEPFVFRRDDDDSFPDETKAPVRASGTTSWGAPFTIAFSLADPPRISRLYAQLPASADSSPGDHDQLVGGGGRWKNMRLDILCSDTDNPDDDDLLYFWDTDAVVPFRQWLCWIDYYRGILFCDVFRDPTPTVSFLRLPLDEFPSDNIRINTRSSFYRGVSVVNHGRELKFVNVARHDGIPIGALKPGTGFTITCHTLLLVSEDGGGGGGGGGGMEWEEDYRVTSDELWDANPPEHLPRDILMYPQVDIDRPHVVHFLYIEWGYAKKKMWVVSIDMSTKVVESFSLYINGWEGLLLHADDRDLIEHKSLAYMMMKIDNLT
ncbi:unnamed protein product [Urochloa decumbens]|uniref:DUF1618 domain-containing protein n=1 Tax=Urochloa decumbens TaxID=240449 RepID=A0ABC9CRM0_9POAL